MNLRDATVVITGGASGIGLALAREVADRGAVPVLLDRDGDAAEAAAATLGDEAFALACDVTDLPGTEEACADVVRRRGGIDVLVANAGIAPEVTGIVGGDRDAQRRVLDINLHGVWHTIWAGAPHVVARQGHVLLISSVAAFLPAPATAAYGASKAGVEALARALRIELAPTGTTVGVAHFGLINTPLIDVFTVDPIAARLEGLLGRFQVRREPQETAAHVARAIERRRSRIVYPAPYVPLYALRGILGPVSDAAMVRLPVVRKLMADLRARDHAEVPAPTGVAA